MSYLIYVNELGPNYKGDNIYEFIFSDSLENIWGENWDAKPSNRYPLPPDLEHIKKVGVLKNDMITMSVIQNSDYFSMIDSMDGIIALGYENESDDVDFDRQTRLVFSFGETEESVKNKLYERDIVLEFEKKLYMNTNQKKLKLIKEGFRPSTLQYLSDKQVNALFTRLLESKKEPNEVQTVTSTKIIATPDEVKKGVSTQGKSMAKMLPDGKIEFTEDTPVDKDDEDKGEVSQDPVQVQGPDGMDDDSDNQLQEKFQSKSQQKYFFARCNDKSQSKKIRDKWCRMADEFAQDTKFDKLPEKKKEPKENFSFDDYTKKVGAALTGGMKNNLTKISPSVTIGENEIEKQIMRLVEKHITPKMKKEDLLSLIEGDTKTAPAKPKVKPGTKPKHPFQPDPEKKVLQKRKKE